MRVAFALWPAPAHLYPFVPLAWALRNAGHEVVFVSHPDLAETVAASGLPFASMYGEAEAPPPQGPAADFPAAREEMFRINQMLPIPKEDKLAWDTVSYGFLPSMWEFCPFQASPEDPMPAMDGMVTFFRRWKPDLVIWDPCMPGAAVAARAAGARQARQSGTDYNGWYLDTFSRLTSGPDAPDLPNPFAETVRGMAEKYGVNVDHDILYGEWTIDVMPKGMNYSVDTLRLPMRWIPYSEQVAMPNWLYPVPERPRVALSLGLSVRTYLKTGWGWLEALMEALSGLDIEVIATLDESQLAAVSTVPGNVRVVDYLPLDYLLPTCSALIHHGGLGTMAPAGQAGVPQLVVDLPEREDGTSHGYFRYKLAPITGRYVTSLGAGEVMDLGQPSIPAIRDQITRVIADPAFAVGAARLRTDMLAAPSPSDLVPTLEKLTFAGHR
ncbi:nucleotide disphospho-sugar-binding domain-containing protein [Micromonospora sp. NPDC048999]|uniref:nucleotide disphospho-sugar-binding domain-containing protein n=1 Tax=Micromonospora sp. NPDC048999 TaxID=3155391 RepID=UPI0033D680B2